jgi:hypothetical protein
VIDDRVHVRFSDHHTTTFPGSIRGKTGNMYSIAFDDGDIRFAVHRGLIRRIMDASLHRYRGHIDSSVSCSIGVPGLIGLEGYG